MNKIPASLKFTACLLGGVLALAAFQTDKDKSKASIEGKITNAVSGDPLKKATVILSSHGTPIQAESDDKGQFSFPNLEPGSYTLVAQRAGFAPGFYGARGKSMSGTTLELTAGQTMKDLNFKLSPNAVIAGKIVDEDGDAVANVMVIPLIIAYQRGRKQYLPAGTPVQSNDAGEYRLGGLRAGKYVLCGSNFVNNLASGMTGAAKATPDKPEPTYTTTYYPSTLEQSQAYPVEVSAGGEVRGMDIRMQKVDAFRVKGKFEGAPAGKMTLVTLTPKNAGVMGIFSAARAQVQPDGTFEIRGVAPGSYTLAATQDFISSMGTPQPVEVKDQHLKGLMLQGGTTVEVSAAVSLEGQTKDKVKMSHIKVSLEAVDGININPPKGTADEAGKLTIKDVPPGKYIVNVDGGSEAVTVKSIKFSDREVGDDGIELTSGTASLQVVLTTEVAQVQGNITGDDGKPMQGVTVVLVPDSRKLSLFKETTTNQNGIFTFKNLRPGDYKVLAFEETDPGAYQNPEFLDKYIRKAEVVSLHENDKKVFALKALK